MIIFIRMSDINQTCVDNTKNTAHALNPDLKLAFIPISEESTPQTQNTSNITTKRALVLTLNNCNPLIITAHWIVPTSEAKVKLAIADAEHRLGINGRLVIRPSGTEPLIRVMAEGDDQTLVENVVNELVDVISRYREAA